MSAELIILGAEGVGIGLVSSFISGAMDLDHATKGGMEIMDVAFTTGVLTGACTLATMYLAMPPYIPVALSVLIRATHEARELYLKSKGLKE